jgi:TonB family protein
MANFSALDAGAPTASSITAGRDAQAVRHAEPWPTGNVERWKAALGDYKTSIRQNRLVPLGSADTEFARYIVAMHERIHPFFGDWFLRSLDDLPATDPMNAPELQTRVEIVIDKSGRATRTGVVWTTGNSAFDVAVLESLDRAQPFAPPSSEILSADGNLYMHWLFYRDEVCGCSALGARPLLMR